MFGIIAAAFLAAQPAPAARAAADPVVAEIARLEQQWGEAFVGRDFDFIERIVAPEYQLVGADATGRHAITPRHVWMKNARGFSHHAFEVETVDVNRVGDTAVASARGLWTVSFAPGQPGNANPLLRHRYLGPPRRPLAGDPPLFPPPWGTATEEARSGTRLRSAPHRFQQLLTSRSCRSAASGLRTLLFLGR